MRSLRDRRFSWLHFTSMLLAALLVLLPVLLFHTALSAKLAVGHFTAGFVELKTSGVVMIVRERQPPARPDKSRESWIAKHGGIRLWNRFR